MGKTTIYKRIVTLFLYADTLLLSFYFFRFSFWIIKINIFEISILLTLLFAAIYFYSAKQKPVFGFIWPYIFLIIAVIAVFLSPDKTKALGILKGWFFIPIAYYWLVINFAPNGKRLVSLTRFLLIALVLICAWAVLQKYGHIGPLFYQIGDGSFGQYLEQGRIFGPFESPNYLAMFIVPVLFLASLPFQWKKLPLYLLIGALVLLTLYLSDSRSGALALFAGSIVVVLLWPSAKKWSIVSKIAVIILALASIYYVAGRINIDSGSNLVRKEIYSYSFDMLKTNYLLGIGLGSFQDKIDQLSLGNQSFRIYGLPYALHPHNIFLAVWLYTGLAGIITFLSGLFIFFYRGLKKRSPDQVLILGAMTAILVHGLFDTTYFKNDLSAIFWLSVALLYIYTNEKRPYQN